MVFGSEKEFDKTLKNIVSVSWGLPGSVWKLRW